MSILAQDIFPPGPGTVRAQTLHIAYDAVYDRIAYPQGKSIVVRLLDFNSAQIKPCMFNGHIAMTTVAAFAPHGNFVASGDIQGYIKVWDSLYTAETDWFQQPTLKSEFKILTGPIRSIVWDSDGQRLIAVGQGKEKFGHCFTFDTGNSIGEIQGHAAAINAVAIRPVRPYRAATVSDDKAMAFFNGPPFKFDKSVRGLHSKTIRDVKFSPNGQYLVSVGSDRNIILYEGMTGEFIRKIENAHNASIFAVAWNGDSKSFVTASADGSLRLWLPQSDTQEHTYIVNSYGDLMFQQVGVVISKDYIVSLSLNGDLNLFQCNSTAPYLVFRGHNTLLTAVNIGSDGNLRTGGSNGQLFAWAIKEDSIDPIPTPIGSTLSCHNNLVLCIAGDYTCGWDDRIILWDNGKVAASAKLTAQPKKILLGDTFITVLFESAIGLYSSKLEPLVQLKLNYVASDASLSSTGHLYTADVTNNTLQVYKVCANDISEVKELEYPKIRSLPCIVRVSPDASHVAVAETSGKYLLYNTKDALVVTTRWAFHTSRVSDAKWTLDSKFVISAGLDSSIFLYSVDHPSKVLKLALAHQNGVTGIDWLRYDAESTEAVIVSIGLDGALKTWKVDLRTY